MSGGFWDSFLCTMASEGFWGYLKCRLAAKRSIWRERLPLYLTEYVWRYNDCRRSIELSALVGMASANKLS